MLEDVETHGRPPTARVIQAAGLHQDRRRNAAMTFIYVRDFTFIISCKEYSHLNFNLDLLEIDSPDFGALTVHNIYLRIMSHIN